MASLTDKFKTLAKGRADLGFDPLGNDESKLVVVRVEDITPDPNQPRKDVGDLTDIKASIQRLGIVQPIIVSPIDQNRYLIIAGERRFTAARELGLRTVPALVRTIEDHRRLEFQLVENLHRKDLDPFDEATALQRLADEFGLTQDNVAERIGKSRTHVTQTLQLTKIPEPVRRECQSSDIPLSRDTLYLVAKQDNEKKMRHVIAMANLPIEERRAMARKGKPRSQSTPTTAAKPKMAYRTDYEATVIVQSETGDLTKERIVAALRQAISKATGENL